MKLFIQPTARHDVLRQYQYYLDVDRPDVAERFYIAVQDTFGAMVQMPLAGAPRLLGDRQLAGLRVWRVKGFPAFGIYALARRDALIVLRVLHGKRDIGALFNDETPENDV